MTPTRIIDRAIEDSIRYTRTERVIASDDVEREALETELLCRSDDSDDLGHYWGVEDGSEWRVALE